MHIITHRYCVLFSWRGALSLWFACKLQSTIINRLSLSVSLDLSLSLSPLSLSLSLSFSLPLSSPTPKLSLSLSLPLSLSFTPAHFFSGIRSFRHCVMSGWKGTSDCFAFFPSSLSYIVPDIMSFFSRIWKIKAYLSGPSSSKTGFLRSKFALYGLT